jgi:EAL domain-containing protein (putative c-di-GMP-specific phosphodiesterase class I)
MASGLNKLRLLLLNSDLESANRTCEAVKQVRTAAIDRAVSIQEATSLLSDGDFDIVISAISPENLEEEDFLGFIGDLATPPDLIFYSDICDDGESFYTTRQLAASHGLNVLGTIREPVSSEEVEARLSGFRRKHLGTPVISYDGIDEVLSLDQLREGIEKGYLFPYFQPKIHITSGDLVGVECLARWNDPERGMIFPNAFIPVAEHNGMLRDLTRSIFTQAMEQAAEWQMDGLELNISINATVENLEEPDFPDFVVNIAERAGIRPDFVLIELKESNITSNMNGPLKVLSKLRNKGIGISIDDFGGHASSMGALSQIPATEIKVDRDIVDGAHEDKDKRLLLKSSIDTGHQLGLTVVAEGAENIEEWHVLEKLGCDLVQGYFCARPMPGNELAAWYEDWQTTRPETAKAISVGGGDGGAATLEMDADEVSADEIIDDIGDELLSDMDASLRQKLKHRGVIRMGVAYGLAVFILIYFINTAGNILGLPASTADFVMYIGFTGFPLALFYAWAFKWSENGIKRRQNDTHTFGYEISSRLAAGYAIAIMVLGYLIF